MCMEDGKHTNACVFPKGQFRLILPAVTALGIRLSHASREGSALGVLLSNTWITYPGMGDNLGKLRIIPHRSGRLERTQAKNSGVPGWVCGLSGCSGCKGPTSRRRVRAMGVVARRWILRHESRPYGAQQARKLRNARKRDEGIPSACTQCMLFSSVNSWESKGWVRLVPAAAVIPAALVVIVIIGPKASVAGSVNLWVNR